MTRLVSFGVLVGAIAVIGFLFYRVISGFLLPMFLAALLVVIFQPWFRYFIVKCGDRVHLAALLTTISAIVVVIGPAILVCALAVWELWPGDGATGPTFSDSLGSRLAGLRKSLEDISHGTLKLDVRYDAKSCVDDLRYIESSIASLRKDAAVGATYRGDELALAKLLDAIDALKSIIKRDEDSSVTVDGTQQPSPDSRAKLDSELLSEVSETLRQAADGEAITPGSLQYQLLLDEADRRFRVFVLALYDNSASVWLADLMHPTDDELRALSGELSTFVPGLLRSVGGKTGSIVANTVLTLVVTILAFYFFLADGPRMVQTVMRLSPLDDQHERQLVNEFDRISRAVVLATLLSAVAQGLLAGVAFWLISLSVEEFNFVFSLTLLTMVLALIPFVGAASVWVPVSLWLFFHSPASGGEPHRLAAILLAVYGAGVISMADNVIKPLVLHGQSNLHPLLALLSVLGGVHALGPIGILVGPMVVVFLQTLLNILHSELMTMERVSDTKRGRQTLPAILSLRQRRL
ncbi:MAG: AI-2E family transporter [Planctomycetaceae bacterium]|nr:AI-2E family transporter [Planctomycetales bacterium]MCB9927557.1 AI-2E family transporter [Planctomycetaceae bacterium]